MKEIYKLVLSKNNDSEEQALTFGELYQWMQDEIDDHERADLKQALMETPISVNIIDSNGIVMEGKTSSSIDWTQDGSIVITSNFSDIFPNEIKDEKEYQVTQNEVKSFKETLASIQTNPDYKKMNEVKQRIFKTSLETEITLLEKQLSEYEYFLEHVKKDKNNN